jgi:large subunit ribosomal protein L24
LRRGDEVVVIAGDDRGRRGKIVKIDRNRGRVVVEGVNRVKRHQRPTQKNPQGGVVEKDLSIHVSNVRFWDATKSKASKIVRKRLDDGRSTRVSKASGETLEG